MSGFHLSGRDFVSGFRVGISFFVSGFHSSCRDLEHQYLSFSASIDLSCTACLASCLHSFEEKFTELQCFLLKLFSAL